MLGYTLQQIIDYRRRELTTPAIAARLGLEERMIDRVERAIRNSMAGALARSDNPEKVAQMLDITPRLAEQAMFTYNIAADETKRACTLYMEERFLTVEDLLDEGATNTREIAQHMGITPDAVRRHAWKGNIPLKSRFKTNRERKREAERAATGKPSADDRRYRLEQLVQRAASLPQIGVAEHCSKQRAQQLLQQYHLHDEWKQRCEEKKQHLQKQSTAKDVAIGQITGLLKRRVIDVAHQESWARGKTEEYIQTKGPYRGTYTHKQLMTLFAAYERAKKEGERMSFEKLGAPAGLSAPVARHILDHVGLESMYWKRGYRKQIVPTATQLSGLGLSARAIGCFLGVDREVIGRKIHAAKKPAMKMFNIDGKRHILDHWIANEIYEAQSLRIDGKKMNKYEIAYLLDTDAKVVQYALDTKDFWAPTIIKILEILHPTENIRYPYLTPRLRITPIQF